MELFTEIKFNPDFDALCQKVHAPAGSDYASELKSLLTDALPLLIPKAVVDIAYIGKLDGDKTEIGGTVFTSSVLAKNLADIERVFPFIVTCGSEINNLEIDHSDMLKSYYLDEIKEAALGCASQFVTDFLRTRYGMEHAGIMSPGSLPNWPIQQQTELFHLLKNGPDDIGVSLTESFLMIPAKSLSGIFFESESSFKSCMLCPRENCRGRRAPYDPHMTETEYGQDSH